LSLLARPLESFSHVFKGCLAPESGWICRRQFVAVAIMPQSNDFTEPLECHGNVGCAEIC
jgi:hypothetical protein